MAMPSPNEADVLDAFRVLYVALRHAEDGNDTRAVELATHVHRPCSRVVVSSAFPFLRRFSRDHANKCQRSTGHDFYRNRHWRGRNSKRNHHSA
jgi:hypothetical protein